MSEAVAEYLTDGGLVTALTDLEAALAALEQHDDSSASRFPWLLLLLNPPRQ